MKDDIAKALINLHDKTGKEWIDLNSIYKEVERIKGIPNVNNGASIRRTLETHTKGFDAFDGLELYISYEKGTGLYKSCAYEKYKFINNMSIGDSFVLDQLMEMFKISGQSGMMKTNLLNVLVLITSESNGVYVDSDIENGAIQYTGEGKIGNQTITKNNKTLFYSRETDIPVYLFSKDSKRMYTFEGKVELYDEPYQVFENDTNGDKRKVWKFPLRIVYQENVDHDDKIKKISYEIIEIENKFFTEINEEENELKFMEGPLNIRKYRRTGKNVQRSSKPDFIAQEIIKNKQGIINEKSVYEKEIQRLYEEEAHDQAKLMKDFFDNKKENEGFDILSFEKNEAGQYVEKYIEVKSTKGNEGTPIDITVDEINFAKDHLNDYYLYRIINSNSDKRYCKIVKGKDLLEIYSFVPVSFKIYLK